MVKNKLYPDDDLKESTEWLINFISNLDKRINLLISVLEANLSEFSSHQNLGKSQPYTFLKRRPGQSEIGLDQLKKSLKDHSYEFQDVTFALDQAFQSIQANIGKIPVIDNQSLDSKISFLESLKNESCKSLLPITKDVQILRIYNQVILETFRSSFNDNMKVLDDIKLHFSLLNLAKDEVLFAFDNIHLNLKGVNDISSALVHYCSICCKAVRKKDSEIFIRIGENIKEAFNIFQTYYLLMISMAEKNSEFDKVLDEIVMVLKQGPDHENNSGNSNQELFIMLSLESLQTISCQMQVLTEDIKFSFERLGNKVKNLQDEIAGLLDYSQILKDIDLKKDLLKGFKKIHLYKSRGIYSKKRKAIKNVACEI